MKPEINEVASKHLFKDSNGFAIRDNEKWAVAPSNEPQHPDGVYNYKIGIFDIPNIPEPKAPNCTDLTVQMIFCGHDGWGFEQLKYPEKEVLGRTLLDMETDGKYTRNTWTWFSVWPNKSEQ